MRAKAIHAALLAAALAFAVSINLQAAPSLPITEPPVTSTYMDGPNIDPWTTNGQWFLNMEGEEEFRTHEFHDNLPDLGGGAYGPDAINGTVVSIQYAVGGSGGYGDDIVGFKIEATIANDTHTALGEDTFSDNSHGESRQEGTEFYAGVMVDTKLTTEFAIADTDLLPAVFSGPYQNLWDSYIIADNEDQQAWYCWNEQEPPMGGEPGNYYVPTWDFGDIPVDQSATRTLDYSVDPPMDSSDPRYGVIYASLMDGIDIFANRTTSLKISTWIDNLGEDAGANFPDGVQRSSNVSVFHNIEEEPEISHKMHWPQLPDPNGWDVRACDWAGDEMEKILADDFLCTSNGPITKITFWGSFQWDEYMYGETFHGINNFHLSLHKDIPAGQLEEWSMPGELLWEQDIDPYNPPEGWTITVEPEEPSEQGWYDPNHPENTEHPNHMDYFRYEVTIPESDAFVQTEGEIYWLDIAVRTGGPQWGWKTSRSEHFNDDAVWADRPVLEPTQWNELIDPFTGDSLDLAFIIDGGGEEPPPDEFDWGDAPDPAYLTLAASGGASHVIVLGMHMGALIDPEPDGQPTPNADGDDFDGNNDDDGVVFNSLLVPGTYAQIAVTVSAYGFLDVWDDFSGSGGWPSWWGGWVNAGTTNLSIFVPPATSPGQSFMRFRFSSSAVLGAGGPAPDGEVEDYEVFIEEPPPRPLDYGDAPTSYPTLLANNGASHVPSGPVLGNLRDLEFDGQPTFGADGDDINNLNDEDGIVFTTALISGAPATVQVAVSGIGGILQGWIDWNADGDWADASEQIINNLAVSAGINTVNFSVPNGATNIPTYARFRISTTTGLPPSGPAQDGEVEDYMVDLDALKWLQIPEQGKEGVDVNNTFNQLADDFVCTASGPITDIHIWGSFRDDILPLEGPGGLIFRLSIWSDVPAGADVPYSHPGQLLWAKAFHPAQYTAGHIWRVPEGEWWHDPGTPNWIHPGDHNIYQFDFHPLPHEAFIQVEGTIYWLAMEYSYDGESEFEFGWKTTPDAFNDAACYYDPADPIFWKNLVYAPQHERAGELLEFAFALSGEEGDVEDWGDAPDPKYPTLRASAGARHIILTNFFLGARIDAERNGQPTNLADGDDLAGFDDEDGVAIGSLIRGSNVAVNVFLTSGIGGGLLDAWVDFDRSGTWLPGEKVFNGTALVPGANALSFTVPSSAALGDSYARFRLSSTGGLLPAGAAIDGEVEDYAVTLLQPVPSPDILITNLYFNASNTVATVEWNSQSGITYQMQATTNLMVSNSWMNVGGYVPGPINWQTNNMSAQTNKFYRVTAPWTP